MPSSSSMLFGMKPTAKDTRIVEVYASCAGAKVTLTTRTWWHKLGQAERIGQETRMVRCVLPVPPTNDDLLKYVEAMARFCVDPKNRAFRPPTSLVWREVAFGQDETREHGQDRDGKPFPMDPLPLFVGSTDPVDRSTILSRPEGEKGSAAKPPRSDARAPMVRKLGAGRKFPVDRP
jgi:hypothetical protein